MTVSISLIPATAFFSVSPKLEGTPVAIGHIQKRESLAGEHVAGLHGPSVSEYHERIAVRMAPAKVVEVDLVGPAAE